MKNLTKKQAKKFAQMYVAGLAWHHQLDFESSIIGDNDIALIFNQINSIVLKISPVRDTLLLAGTDDILNYVREHF